MHDIVVGRSASDLKKFGLKGTVLLGRHYITMGQTQSLSQNIYLDVAGAHVVFICGKRGGGKCLTGDSLVSLSDGRDVMIKDLHKIDCDVLSLDTDLKMKTVPRTDFFKREVDTLLKVKLRSGKELKLTPEHPLLTVDGWFPTEKLHVGSRIATPRITNNFGSSDLPKHTIKILAYLIAEGHLGNGFILFSNKDTKIVEDFNDAINSFDENLTVKSHSEGSYRVVDLTISRKLETSKRDNSGKFLEGIKFDKKSSLRKYLESLNMYGKNAIEREIPDVVFMLPKKSLALFLNRLFSCDGTIFFENDFQRMRISYSSSSKFMIYQVQSLLQKFGILSKVRKKKINEFNNYELEIQAKDLKTFIDEIGFFGIKETRQEKSIDLLKNIKHNTNIDTIPKEIWSSYTQDNWASLGRALNYTIPKSAREIIRYAPSRQKLLQVAKHDNDLFLEVLSKSDIFWDEIMLIEKMEGQFEVYDISVPKNHNFVANGIIVHNSYTMGAIAEGFHLLEPAIKQNLSVILLDTMGIYWTMKYPNHQDKILLDEWGLKPDKIPIKIFTPEKYYHIYKEKGIPTDVPFTLSPSSIDQDDWCHAFKLEKYSPQGILISNVVLKLKELNKPYGIKDLISAVQEEKESDNETKNAVLSMFKLANSWGVFSDHGTPYSELAKGGQISVLDVSCYATMPGGWDVKSLIVGIVGQHLFVERMEARKEEEFAQVHSAVNFFSTDSVEKQDKPLVWLVIDEAHEFLPAKGKVASTDALVTIMREGRQPGISLILATQQPGKIHTDVMTQSDTVLSHRITARMDVEALGLLTQSYMREGLTDAIDRLPRVKGAGVLFDDNNEKLYPMRIRPRITWHGGSSPSAVHEEKKTDF